MILNSRGKTICYTAITGPYIYDEGNAIAVAGNRDFNISGKSYKSWGLPVNSYAGNRDAFAAKLRYKTSGSDDCDFFSFPAGNNNPVFICM